MSQHLVVERLKKKVVRGGICTGCGACVALDDSRRAQMVDTDLGPIPDFAGLATDLPELAWDACPGKGVDYPEAYRSHYGKLPEDWLVGEVLHTRTGHAGDPAVRAGGASGGVMTAVLCHLLDTDRIDAALVVRQGTPTPEKARVVFARSAEEVRASSQSVYVPVATLDVLRSVVPGERYAMTCLPDQAAALRVLQAAGHPAAQQITHVLGPYTGTALYPAAVRALLRVHGVRDDDPVERLEWRAGDWPGHLEIALGSGRVIRSKKVYYNFLIPFFVTQNSLQGIDFTGEFCDLSVGDAWSPRFEGQGGGHSTFVTRSREMESIVSEMVEAGFLTAEVVDTRKATEMHGHMIDFKKRGSWIRNELRRRVGLAAPNYGLRPYPVPPSRVAVELIIDSIFLTGGTAPARWVLQQLPESLLGPAFDRARLRWKKMSRPTKRKGLGNLEMRETQR